MKVLGFDPGTATTGFGVIEELHGKLAMRAVGAIQTPASMAAPLRLKAIYDEVNRLINDHVPDFVATERLFFSKNEATALSVGRTIGVILLAVAQRGLPWQEYTPLQVKQAVTGIGTADKKQVQFMVTRLLALDKIPKPDDAADALAVAICHAHSAKLMRMGVRNR
ncbi:MAG TPA: crossover junction endodeoxyribonuclease RuvC [Capsulimonadaceae bacterium]|nr:crossover junction endodeoxyribonuclease RuvC [Capsulimonadaceae bacterium]